ncbi:hypothetical protein [Phyllobacterium sp. SB3]|uniref:hypothetical protein n=1 Tax=Phyllobacterium sp. SB3 TaxID=3156073 RepID=UPI0032AFF506
MTQTAIEAQVAALQTQEVKSADKAWDDLVNKDDRTSPEAYRHMALITRDELAEYISDTSIGSSLMLQSVEPVALSPE